VQRDERRPICFHCDNSPRDCRGWPKELEFIPQQKIPTASQLPSRLLAFKEPLSHFEKRKRVYKRPIDEMKPASEASVALSGSDWSSVSSSNSASLDICPRTVPLSPVARFTRELVHPLDLRVVHEPTVLYLGEYLEGLPAYLGRSDCLDACSRRSCCSRDDQIAVPGAEWAREGVNATSRRVAILLPLNIHRVYIQKR